MTGEIRVPKLNNNDSHYVLVDWLVADGAQVRSGDVVATLETSKALEDLICDAGGTLRHLVAANAECEPGQPLARVDPPGRPAAPVAGDAGQDTPRDTVHDTGRAAAGDLVITAPARARLTELGIEEHRLRRLGKRVIRREDVDRMLELERQETTAAPPESPAGATTATTATAAAAATGATAEPAAPADQEVVRRELSRHQQAVASTVARSHAAIPPAYLALRVEVGEALELTARLRTELRRFVGLPELLVAAVARRHARHPLCFAAADGPGLVSVPAAPHVGVTIDMGTGLHVPVIHDAATRSVEEITQLVARFRDTALRGRFRESELAGANIMVALHNDGDVLFGIPIVFPGHSCAISLSGTRHEPSVGPDGALCLRPVVTLGIAHDHRVVNGQEAAAFLRAVKAALEDPNSLMASG